MEPETWAEFNEATGEWEYAPDAEPVPTTDDGEETWGEWFERLTDTAKVVPLPVVGVSYAFAETVSDAAGQVISGATATVTDAAETVTDAIGDVVDASTAAAGALGTGLAVGGVLSVAAVSIGALFLADQLLARGALTASVVERIVGRR